MWIRITINEYHLRIRTANTGQLPMITVDNWYFPLITVNNCNLLIATADTVQSTHFIICLLYEKSLSVTIYIIDSWWKRVTDSDFSIHPSDQRSFPDFQCRSSIQSYGSIWISKCFQCAQAFDGNCWKLLVSANSCK